MNLRHAAALAIVGWYLMVPPTTSSENWERVTPRPPLGQWTTRDAYDSADACRKAQKDLSTKSADETSEDYRRWLAGRTSSNQLLDEWSSQYSLLSAIRLANQEAQCIATDDPRLKETR